MAEDRFDPTRPEDPRLAAERAAELVTWCDSLEAELDDTEQDLPKELVELAPPPDVKERVLWSIRAEGRDDVASGAAAGEPSMLRRWQLRPILYWPPASPRFAARPNQTRDCASSLTTP